MMNRSSSNSLISKQEAQMKSKNSKKQLSRSVVGEASLAGNSGIDKESIFTSTAIQVKLEPASCFMWFLIKRKSIGDVLPDYELSYCKKIFKEMINKQPSCHEALFGLAKLLFHDKKHMKSLNYLEKAIKITQDPLYKK